MYLLACVSARVNVPILTCEGVSVDVPSVPFNNISLSVLDPFDVRAYFPSVLDPF